MDNQPQNQPPKPEQEPPRNPYEQQPSQQDPSGEQSPMMASPVTTETEPQTAQSPITTPMPEETPPQKKSNKKLIAIVVAIVVAVLLSAGALAYTVWYQNPDKVVSDSLMNAIKAKSMTFTATVNEDDETPGSISVSGVYKDGTGSVDAVISVTTDGRDTPYKVEGSGLLDDKGDLYVKVTNASSVIDQLADGQQTDPTIEGFYDEFATKIGDKWIKVSSDELKELSEDVATSQKCLQETFKKIQEDSNLSSELATIYREHTFLSVKEELGTKDGSMGYLLDADEAKANEFAKAFKDTAVYTSLHDCDDSFMIDEEDLTGEKNSEGDGDARAELWVSQWSHEITKFSIEGKNDDGTGEVSIVFEPTFNKPVEVKTPSESMNTDDVVKAFEELQMDIFQYSFRSAGGDPSLLTPPSAAL